ncbi:MAG: hypothetical protein M3450_19375, partial [Actinomycetota bacterium]|nr:hypothetical protein [Actinomycetota bacterium]
MVALSAVLAFGLVACGDDGDDDGGDAQPAPTTAPAPQGSPMVTIDMIDHAFQVSGPLTAGGTIRLSNKGTEFHMIGLGRFKPGKTMTDLQRVLNEAGPPGGGAPSTTVQSPGQSTTSTTRAATTTSTTRGSGTTTTTAAGGQGE